MRIARYPYCMIVVDDDGRANCEDGPAIIYDNGDLGWARHGRYHRIGGPALVLADGQYRWYIDGILYTDNKINQQASGISDAEMIVIILTYGNVKCAN